MLSIIAGAIRNYSGIWRAIQDADHEPINIASLDATSTYIRLYYAFEASLIHVFKVTTDEACAAARLFVGASVGKTYADIYCYSHDGILVNPAAIANPRSNLWVYGLFTVNETVE